MARLIPDQMMSGTIWSILALINNLNVCLINSEGGLSASSSTSLSVVLGPAVVVDGFNGSCSLSVEEAWLTYGGLDLSFFGKTKKHMIALPAIASTLKIRNSVLFLAPCCKTMPPIRLPTT